MATLDASVVRFHISISPNDLSNGFSSPAIPSSVHP